MSSCFKKISVIVILSCGFLFAGCFEAMITEWYKGEIPYYFSGDFSDADVATVKSAMSTWESVCGVVFTEVEPRAYAYSIIRSSNSNTWSSTIGENNVQSYMYYGEGDNPYGHALHELGHCIGLLHEQQRPDRDLYVQIVWDNILPDYWQNFDKQNNPLIKENLYPYDYDSIMHYPTTGFSYNGNPTIITIDPLQASRIGQRISLSIYDIQKARAIYGPSLGDQ